MFAGGVVQQKQSKASSGAEDAGNYFKTFVNQELHFVRRCCASLFSLFSDGYTLDVIPPLVDLTGSGETVSAFSHNIQAQQAQPLQSSRIVSLLIVPCAKFINGYITCINF